MNRRQFLGISAAAAVTGCREAPSPPPAPPTPTLTDEERARIAQEKTIRRQHLAELEKQRVHIGDKFTTAAAAVDITTAIPELKTQIRHAIRLHPRFGEEPPPDASKLGGKFLWPADAKWPTDPATLIPLTPVLQIHRGDTSTNQFEFRPGCDLMQVLWTPRDPIGGELFAAVVWRRVAEVQGQKLRENAEDEFAFPNYLPVPCRVHPEWVVELPDWETLRRTDLRAKLDLWQPPKDAGLPAKDYYTRYLASAHGSKLGGWPRLSGTAPSCKTCQWPMDYVLTIDATEWSPTDANRWRPVQDQGDALARRAAAGLALAGGNAVELYICHRCQDWPVRAMVVK